MSGKFAKWYAQVMEKLQPAIDEANSKQLAMHDFMKSTYSNQLSGIVALVSEIKRCEKSAKENGVEDVSEIIEMLMLCGGIAPLDSKKS